MKGLSLVCLLAACDRGATSPTIVPGERIGSIELGMRWCEVHALLGEPSSEPTVLVRLGHARWRDQGIEVVFTSPAETTAADDAVVIGIASSLATTRAAVERSWGPAPEQYDGHGYYPSGLGVDYSGDDGVERIAVFPAISSPRAGIAAIAAVGAGVELDGRELAVVDMHLHPGDYPTMAPEGRSFITANLPSELQIFAPELLDRLSDPWAEHVGIAEQTSLAGVGHAVLFAVYAPHSTGVFSNEALLAVLDDPRNVAADGRPWAWGMASINFEGWSTAVADARLAALREALATRPERLIGIKLAHAHQGVRLDDPTYHGVYAIAEQQHVPVLLHTGFSPFPGTQSEPDYYDPVHLSQVVAAYPNLDIVLSHVGQGDARATAHALDLAAANPHVWLELSALNRPLLVGADGMAVSTAEPQYPSVLAAIRERGLIARTLFASDGPQYSGGIRNYLAKLVAGMRAANYSADEIEAVLGGNFDRLFERARAAR
jgi:uncharacterized protein